MGELTVHVIKGSNLKIGDHFVMSSDPYVEITLGEQTRKTRVKKRTLNPVWEEVFTFTNVSYPDHRFLVLEVFDEDKAPKWKRKDFLGSAKIDLKPLIQEKTEGKKAVPQSSNNNLAKDSWIVQQNDGRLFQDVSLKLAHVKHGLLEMKLEWQPESKS
eukprot:PITA_11950